MTLNSNQDELIQIETLEDKIAPGMAGVGQPGLVQPNTIVWDTL